jgi:tetratricopeptide (TPR) repeat protein
VRLSTFAVILRFLRVLSGTTLLFITVVAPAAAQQGDLNTIQKRFSELYAAGNYPAALIEAQKLEAQVKARFGTDHPNYVVALNTLASVYRAQGKYAEAEAHNKRALAIAEAKLGKDHAEVARTLNNLALVYGQQGKYAEAEANYKRALAIQEAKFGKDHPEATILGNLAGVYEAQGKYAEAEVHHKRALAIREAKLGTDHPEVAMSLGALASVYQAQGKYAEAEAHSKRALAIFEAKLGKDHPRVAETLNTLAVMYEAQGKYAEAEANYKRALAIRETKLGKDHPEVATTLTNLTGVYQAQGKYAEAEAHLKRALAIKEAKLGKDHPEVAMTLNGLASVYQAQGKHAEAEALHKRALAIFEAKLGKDHWRVAESLNNLANVYQAKGKHAEAEAHYKRALAIDEATLGTDHPEVATILTNLALAYQAQGKYAEAEALHKRALAIAEAKLGKDHPDVAITLYNLADMYQLQDKYAEALVYARKASAAVIAHAQFEGAGAQERGGTKGLVEKRAAFFRRHVLVLAAAGRQGIETEAALTREGFEIAQWAVQSSAAAALTQMAARQSKGEGALAQAVRDRQDLERQWHVADERLNAAVGRGDVQLASELRRELSRLDTNFAEIDARLAREFPDYAELSNPKPLSIGSAQALLSANEALVSWLAGEKESYVFALTRDGFEWKTIPLGAQALSEKVTAFRHGLDVDALRRGLERVECTQADADKRGLSRIECGQVLAKECAQAAAEGRGLGRTECNEVAQSRRELFDLALAHELYGALIGPVEALIKDKSHLLVVPSGALTALPFHLLVTEKPAAAVPHVETLRDLATYRDAAWLLKRHAISVLPSVTSLKALRVFAHKDLGSKPMVGFGDPIFGPEAAPEASQRTAQARALVTRSYTDYWQGAGIDRSKLAQALPRLPDTADELKAVAQKLGAPASDIKLRKDASETNVKRAPLPTTASSTSPPTVSSPATSRALPSRHSLSPSRRSRAISTTAS